MNELSLFEDCGDINLKSTDEFYFNQKEFKNLILTNEAIKEKEFNKCRFVSCNFFKTKFISSEFEDCTFQSCDLSLASVTGSKFLSIFFKGSKSVGVDWRGVRKPSTFKFVDCKIDNSIFYKMDLRAVNILNCSAQNVDFIETDLSKAVFSNTDLLGSKFSNTNLSFADFSESFNYNIDPNNNKFKKTIFSMPDAVSLLNTFDIIIK